jgi:hypothetical protein
MKPRCQTPRSAQAGMTPELDGQAVVVTGGSAGVGLVSARAAREEDAGVILAARNPERLDRPHRRSARAARPPSTRSTRLRSTGSSPTTLSRSTTRSSASGPKYRSKSPRPHPRRPTAGTDPVANPVRAVQRGQSNLRIAPGRPIRSVDEWLVRPLKIEGAWPLAPHTATRAGCPRAVDVPGAPPDRRRTPRGGAAGQLSDQARARYPLSRTAAALPRVLGLREVPRRRAGGAARPA